MHNATPIPRYGRPLILVHWLTVVVLAAVYAAMELRGVAPRGGALREVMKQGHFLLGMSLLALLVVRLGLRWRIGTPPADPALPRWQQRLAGAMHALLYLFLALMPLLGWLLVSAEGLSVALFGQPLPALVAADRGLAEQVEEWHEAVANLGYLLIGAHAAAALLHHTLFRHATLRRMLP
jgi:superoxide oxidase